MVLRRSILLSIVILAGLILGSCAPVAPEPVTVIETVEVIKEVMLEPTAIPEKHPIKIGIAAAFSGSIAYIGEGEVMGTTLALEQLGGEIAGHPIELVPVDNACDPTQAVQAIRRLVDVEQVHMILGSGCSSCTLAAMPLVQEAEIVELNIDSSSTTIFDDSGVGGNEWHFRSMNDANILAKGFAPYVAERTDSIALIAFNDDYGRSTTAAVMPELEALGVEVVADEYFERGAPDMRPILLKIKDLNPESLMITATESDAVTILRQFRELGLTQKLFGINSSMVSPLFAEMTADEPGLNEGVLEGKNWAPGLNPEFDAAFVARWGTAPSPHRSYYYHGFYYIVAEAIRIADEKGNGVVTREGIRDALEEVRVETPIGTLWFDDHNQAYPSMAISTVRDGEIVVLDVFPTNPHE